jgi:hypothetical protein
MMDIETMDVEYKKCLFFEICLLVAGFDMRRDVTILNTAQV